VVQIYLVGVHDAHEADVVGRQALAERVVVLARDG
jgi:hypothetical protein